jgi:hypothetical protein
MEPRDRIGRKRRPDQNRGLRPLFPKLPTSFESRAIRIAMTTPAWHRIDGMTAQRVRQTRPRALGEVIETLLAYFERPSVSAGANSEPEALTGAAWQGWQIQKERALLPASQTH